MKYEVLQVVLKEELIGTGSRNLSELESVLNRQAEKGYRLHSMSTTSSGSKGLLGGDRIQATLIFEKTDDASGYGNLENDVFGKSTFVKENFTEIQLHKIKCEESSEDRDSLNNQIEPSAEFAKLLSTNSFNLGKCSLCGIEQKTDREKCINCGAIFEWWIIFNDIVSLVKIKSL